MVRVAPPGAATVGADDREGCTWRAAGDGEDVKESRAGATAWSGSREATFLK